MELKLGSNPMDEKRQLRPKFKHDLRTPYSTLMGVIAALKEEPDMDREDQNEFLEILELHLRVAIGFSVARVDVSD